MNGMSKCLPAYIIECRKHVGSLYETRAYK